MSYEGKKVCDTLISSISVVESGDVLFFQYHGKTLDCSPFKSTAPLKDYVDYEEILKDKAGLNSNKFTFATQSERREFSTFTYLYVSFVR